jgi:hypothetical protein
MRDDLIHHGVKARVPGGLEVGFRLDIFVSSRDLNLSVFKRHESVLEYLWHLGNIFLALVWHLCQDESHAEQIDTNSTLAQEFFQPHSGFAKTPISHSSVSAG